MDIQKEIRAHRVVLVPTTSPSTHPKAKRATHNNLFHHRLQPPLNISLTCRILYPALIPLTHEFVDALAIVVDNVNVALQQIHGGQFGNAGGDAEVSQDAMENLKGGPRSR